MQETQVYSLLMLGSSQCGKTLLNRVYNEKYNSLPTPTELADCEIINFDITNESLTQKMIITIWDLPSDETWNVLIESSIQNIEGIFLIFDVTNTESFTYIKKMLTVIKQFHEIGTIPIVLIGNKIDLKDERIVDNEDAIELAHLNRMKYFETSAKTTQGVEEAFLSLIHSVYLCNNRNGKQKLGNVMIRKIILNENKEQKRNYKSISDHNKELTTKGLKHLISGIENSELAEQDSPSSRLTGSFVQ